MHCMSCWILIKIEDSNYIFILIIFWKYTLVLKKVYKLKYFRRRKSWPYRTIFLFSKFLWDLFADILRTPDFFNAGAEGLRVSGHSLSVKHFGLFRISEIPFLNICDNITMRRILTNIISFWSFYYFWLILSILTQAKFVRAVCQCFLEFFRRKICQKFKWLNCLERTNFGNSDLTQIFHAEKRGDSPELASTSRFKNRLFEKNQSERS